MEGDEAAAQVGLGLSLIKQLGSSYKSSRDEALRLLLESWLPSQPNLTDDVMNKLWNGLFYCIWDADFQSHGSLIDRLSSLLHRLHNSSLSLHYFSSFLLTMRREWTAVDGLRLDKFYLFIRRFLHYSFALLKIHSWDLDLTSRLISLLEDACFLVKQGHFGVSYQIASVFLEELRPFLPLRPEVLEIFFKPFISVMGSLPDEVLLGKIKSNMFDVLLKMGNELLEVKKLGDDYEVHDNDDAVVLGTIALTMGFSSKFFELASSVECCLGNRKVLIVLYAQFLMLEKDLESSGIQVSIPHGIDAENVSADEENENVATGAALDNDAVEDVANACQSSRICAVSCVLPPASKYEYSHDVYWHHPGDPLITWMDGDKYSDGLYWRKLVRRNSEATVVALKIVLSNGKRRRETIGSGTVVTEDGLVLTCAHLLHDYENPEYCLRVANVLFFNGQTYKVKVVTEDAGKDLALLKINARNLFGQLKLSHATLAMPQKIETGLNAYTTSNPYYSEFSLTQGIVSYDKRIYRDLGFSFVVKLDHDTAILQTDVACEFGKSAGRAVFNSHGEMMGVQFAHHDFIKLAVHAESILKFLEKNNVVVKKSIR